MLQSDIHIGLQRIFKIKIYRTTQMTSEDNSILVVSELSKSFGALKAVDVVSFEVAKGEVFGIAGPNGSGKSTLFNIITRIPFGATSGSVLFDNEPIHDLANNDIAKRGLARTFQRESVFPHLSAIDNVLVTTEQTQRASSFLQRITLAEHALELVGFPATLHNWKAGDLPVFLKKLVMIAGAVALDPSVLLLDEPASSLTPNEIERMKALIMSLNEVGMTILLVEHVLPLLTGVSDRLMVLDQGKVIALGEPQKVIKNPRVVEAYLGAAA